MQRLQRVRSGVNAAWVIHVYALNGIPPCAEVLTNIGTYLHAHLRWHLLSAASCGYPTQEWALAPDFCESQCHCCLPDQVCLCALLCLSVWSSSSTSNSMFLQIRILALPFAQPENIASSSALYHCVSALPFSCASQLCLSVLPLQCCLSGLPLSCAFQALPFSFVCLLYRWDYMHDTRMKLAHFHRHRSVTGGKKQYRATSGLSPGGSSPPVRGSRHNEIAEHHQGIDKSNPVAAAVGKVSLPCPALPCPVPPCSAQPFLPCPSCPALPCPAPPCPALPCPALPCPALPCPAPPCPALPGQRRTWRVAIAHTNADCRRQQP